MLFALPLMLCGMAAQGFDQASLDAKVAEILPRVAELRDREFKEDVPAGVVTPDEFVARAREDMAREFGPDGMRDVQDAYILLGFAEDGTDIEEKLYDLLRDQVGGFYDPAMGKFWMMTTFNKGIAADIIMAHELTHALDDQYYDLDGMLEDALEMSSDTQFALRAVVEGSGTSLMNLYQIQGIIHGWIDLTDPDAIAELQEMLAASASGLGEIPPFLVISLVLPYMEGNKFLVKSTSVLAAATLTPDPVDLNQAFVDLPVSSEQILHPEKYWGEVRDMPVEVTLPDLSALLTGETWGPIWMMTLLALAATLGVGFVLRRLPLAISLLASLAAFGLVGDKSGLFSVWTLADEDVLGELGCAVLTMEDIPNMGSVEGQMASWVTDAGSGWGGDRYALWRGPGGQRLLVWATVWDTPGDAAEFQAAVEPLQAVNPFLVQVDGYETAVILGMADASAVALIPAVMEAVADAHPEWN